MSAFGIIFSNIHDANILELTQNRTMAAVPFGCRYRLIDFTLSNMVNAGITNIGVITHYNYQSLMDHLGSGKDWDLARRTGGIKILPPYVTAYANHANKLYDSRLEALESISTYIAAATEEYVVLSDCDVICNIDLDELIADHVKNNADITVAVKNMPITPEMVKNIKLASADENGRLTDILACPPLARGYRNVLLNSWVMKKQYLQSLLADAAAHRYTSFTTDIMLRNKNTMNYRIFQYNGYFAAINTFKNYYNASMELLNKENREALFSIKSRPVFTKVRNSPPAKYGKDAVVKNSLIADGCMIEGTAENCILFRDVKIGRGTHAKNCILFQNTYTGENVTLSCVIADKNVVFRDNVSIIGHQSKPFYIEKNSMI